MTTSPPTDRESLIACPFCGHTDKLRTNSLIGGGKAVCCTLCGTVGPAVEMLNDDDAMWNAERLWNARFPPGARIAPEPGEKWIDVTQRLPEGNHGALLVTNNMDAEDANGNMSHLWLASMLHPQEDGSYDAFDASDMARIERVSHWRYAPTKREQHGT